MEVHEIKPSGTSRSLPSANPDSDELKRIRDTEVILQKIIEVNKKHGLTPKGLKTDKDYIRVPILQRSGSAKQANFQFPNSPFSNPILDYLLQESNKNKYGVTSNDITKQVTALSVANTNPKIESEDNVPGQYIKRKITHHQTFLMPVLGNSNNPNLVGYPNQPPFQPNEMPQYPSMPALMPPPLPPQQQLQDQGEDLQPSSNSTGNSSHTETLKKKLENQTVENIKNIINRQVPPPQFIFNPYYYPQSHTFPYFQSTPGSYYYGQPEEVQPPPHANPHSYRINGPNARIPNEVLQQQFPRPSKQWEWPLAQYFPIVIRDPLQQIFNAFTTMVEYGPPQSSSAGGSSGPQCASQKDAEKTGKTLTDEEPNSTDSTQNLNEQEEALVSEISRNGKNSPLDFNYQDDFNVDKPINMDIENIEMRDDEDNPMRLTFSFRATPDVERALKDFRKQEGDASVRLDTKVLSPSSSKSARKNVKLYESEVDKGLFAPKDKVKNVQNSADTNIKLSSRDNTGSGVFIHKLRVRKGGVAIAGPGGIATAGSGGTAIVGPNGYAYTQPDSVAIAGSGTKVVAVEPGVNLSEVIESVKKNGTGLNPRLGRIVAVGPVVYYNKG